MFVLAALESGEYAAFGSAIVTDAKPRLYPFESYLDVSASSVCFSASGKYGLVAPGPQHEFFVEIRASDENGVFFTYCDHSLPQLTGTGNWVKDCYLLTGLADGGRTALSVLVHPMENQVLDVKASLHLSTGRRVALYLVLAPHDPASAMAKVISLSKHRRS